MTRNSSLLISDVGVGDGGLVCRTDHPQCCDSSTDAVWLSPNNTVISSTRGDGDFYTTRGAGYITLNRYSNTTTAAGTYCCRVPVGGSSHPAMFCAVLTLPAGTCCCVVCEWVIQMVHTMSFRHRNTVTQCRSSDRRCGGGTSSCPHYHDHCHCDHCTGYQVRETCRHCMVGDL